jgi:uncharacterized protein (TIGR02145 family)
MKQIVTLILGVFIHTQIYSQSVPSYVPTNGLVGWWGFNGNAQDGSGNGNHGTVNGATLTTDRFENQNSAYFFHPRTAINFGNSVGNFGNSNFSISLWFTISGESGYLLSKRNDPDRNFSWWVIAPNGFEINQNSNTWHDLEAKMTYSKNAWYNLVIVKNINTYSFYVNGTLVNSNMSTKFFNIRNNSNTLSGMVTYPYMGDMAFHNGKIDDIGIWDRAITQQEINELYNAKPGNSKLVESTPNKGEGHQLNVTQQSTPIKNQGQVNPAGTANKPIEKVAGVKIGNQIWQSKNLDVETFKNGDVIPEAKSDEEWERAGENNEPAWCYYDNDSENGKKYGKLYNHFAVSDTRGLCPTGWHVPSDEEWTRLETFLGDGGGEKLKRGSAERFTWRKDIPCSNCASWSDEYKSKVACHQCKDNRWFPVRKEFMGSGFYALLGGLRNKKGDFDDLGDRLYDSGCWWSSSLSGTAAWERHLSYVSPNWNINRDYYGRSYGFSVRCLKD